jgi:chemosensory pili system protein ChpA (sensor histidine kinase/response regulator)
VDHPRDTESIDDLSALAWVQEELRKSLDAAHKSLRRYLKEAEAGSGSDVDAVDPSVLRHARVQIHQGVGALELVGLPAAAALLRASEAAVSKLAATPRKVNIEAVETVERGSFALLDYLARMLAGKAMPPLALFPQYRALQTLAGASRIHPADLWPIDWRWRDLAMDAKAASRAADADTRNAAETLVLDLMRHPQGPAASQMSDLLAGLAAGTGEPRLRTLWQLAAGFFEGQAQRLLTADNYSKRVASRLLAQLRASEHGDSEVSDRLAHDMLFFCAHSASPGDGRRAPRLAAVRQAFGLVHSRPVDYETSKLGRFDPALVVQARKRVAGAKDSWSAAAGGELHRLSGLVEQFSLVGDSLKRLYAKGQTLADALQDAVRRTVDSGGAPAPELAMEIATSMLYIDASLEDADFDHPDQGGRVSRLAQRIASVGKGAAAQPLEGWMEELYRRVSDRQTMGSVVQELRHSLSEAEKLIDQYFRNPADRQVLIPVPGQLQAMRGVLSVLGMDQASQAVLRMRDDVDALVQTEVDPQRGPVADGFDRLAGNLGALGFLIDMLSVQPQMAKSLFVFDAVSGSLRSVVGGGKARSSGSSSLDTDVAPPPVEPRLIEQAQSLVVAAAASDVPSADVSRELERLSHEALIADQSGLAETVNTAQAALERASGDDERSHAVREEIAEALSDFVATASGAMPLQAEIEPIRLSPMPAPASAPTPVGATGLEDDAEMREIFLEEAREVMEGARAALAVLADASDDVNELTTLRRAFHTLKGSSRMVGLKDFGDAGWACEQLYNARLADAPRADDDLLGFTGDVLTYLGDWVDCISQRRAGGHDPQVVTAAADQLRNAGRRVALPLPVAGVEATQVLPTAAVEATQVLAQRVPDLPQAADLDLAVAEEPAIEAVPQPVVTEFELPPEPAAQPDEPTLELPTEFDLPFDATPVPSAPMALPEVSFDLDLDALDESPLERTQTIIVSERVEPSKPAVPEKVETIELDFNLSAEATPAPAPAVPEHEHPAPTPKPPAPEPKPEPEHEPKPKLQSGAAEPPPDPEQFKIIGPLSISIPLFNIYLSEADELSRRLTIELAEWGLELHRPVGDHAIALAHSLAGSSSTVGFSELSQLARSLEHALMRAHAVGRGDAAEARLFVDVAEEIRRLLHQFAAGFLHTVPPQLWQRLSDHERLPAQRLQAPEQEPAVVEAPRVEPEPVVAAAVEPLPVIAPLPVVHPPARGPEPVPHGPMTALTDLGLPEMKAFSALPVAKGEAVTARADALDDEDDIDAVDAVDAELFPIFEEEGQELLPQLASRMRDWARRPSDPSGASACMRTLHTLKGGARLAGAMRLGEMSHRLETAIEHLVARGNATPADLDGLQHRVDALQNTFEALRSRDEQAYQAASAAAEHALQAELPVVDIYESVPGALIDLPEPTPLTAVVPQPQLVAQPEPQVEQLEAQPEPPPEPPKAEAAPQPAEPSAPVQIDWSRFAGRQRAVQAAGNAAASHAAVRVRGPLLDRLVNHAGEVMITRSRIESDVGQLKGSLGDLTDNLERLRSQLRDIELQGETQITSRMEAAKAASQEFDPLEFDRFTRFQELTRMMAESVNDVATVQRSLQRTLQSTEDELAAQARLTRDMQDDLLRTRMVEFESLSDRLYRVVRLAAKETGKHVRLDLVGGSIEVDRGVLDRMTGAFEHLLRNCVSHGIESPEERSAKGKDPTGQISIMVGHAGNEVGIEFRDDGAGLNLERIRAKGVALGMLAPDAQPTEHDLANLIFTSGFSTADQVTELAGRGVGMDVVRAEVNAMGGRIETATAAGQGTSFRLVLPLTTAVTQVVMLRCGSTTVAVPSTLVEIVRRAKPAEIEQCYASGTYTMADKALPFFWLGALLQASPRGTEGGRTMTVVVIKSVQQRIALHVDEVLGNQEVVVKNLGSQMSRLPGLAGMTLLASGSPALIYNPVALATLYGESAWAMTREALAKPEAVEPAAGVEPVVQAPLVLVVDDSLTVRRVTQRMLVREGYRVALAKDGLEGLEKLAEERPAVLLSDIEMPRMDGFDLVRNLRNDKKLADLPVIMITSRIAQKHKDYAAELGVDHYLGKPYSEEDLLALVARYATAKTPQAV